MNHSINAQFLNGLGFEISIDNHKFIVDAPESAGGNDRGPSPKKLLLAGLAGCTGMDVVSILQKMKVNYQSFNILVEGDVTEEHPKKYTTMKIIYQFTGKDLPIDKLEKAIQLSQDKYCGVAALYKDALKLSYEIQII